MFKHPADKSMSRLVIGNDLLLNRTKDVCFLFGPCNDLLKNNEDTIKMNNNCFLAKCVTKLKINRTLEFKNLHFSIKVPLRPVFHFMLYP